MAGSVGMGPLTQAATITSDESGRATAEAPEQAPTGAAAEAGLWARFSYTAVRAVMAVVLAGLGLRGCYLLGRAFGTLEWCINYKRRQRFHQALEHIRPEGVSAARRRRYCREHFMHARCDKLFELILDCLPSRRAALLFSIEPRELLDASLKRRGGVYVALAHHGAHHVGSIMLSLLGYKVAGVRDRCESGLRRYVQERYRRRFSEFRQLRMFFTDTWPRKLLRCLQEGYVLGSALDAARTRHPNQSTHEATIFGEARRFLTGPIRIALRAKVDILQGFVIPRGNFRYALVLKGPLLEAGSAEREEAAIAAVVQRYAETAEQVMRDTPEHVSRI